MNILKPIILVVCLALASCATTPSSPPAPDKQIQSEQSTLTTHDTRADISMKGGDAIMCASYNTVFATKAGAAGDMDIVPVALNHATIFLQSAILYGFAIGLTDQEVITIYAETTDDMLSYATTPGFDKLGPYCYNLIEDLEQSHQGE